MSRDYSSGAREELYTTSSKDPLILLLEIEHEGLTSPVRAAQDTEDFPHQGHTYTGIGFRARLPADMESGQARAELAVDNVSKDLVNWLEASNGGAEATVRFIQVRRSDPDTREHEVQMDLANVKITTPEVSGELGFENFENLPATNFTYTPERSPGLF